MINRRNLLGLALPALAAGAVTVNTAVKAEDEAKKPKSIAIAMRFEFEGKHYGLAVPIFEPARKRPLGTLEVIDGQETVTLDDREMNILIMMLQDLRKAKIETLRMLRAGETQQ